jgi:hypothetical protein
MASGKEHKATYATDKKNGGYLVRVVGPHANAFAGREVPVTRKDDSEHKEKLVKLLWTGKDDDTGQPIGLYSFAPKPKDPDDEIEF